jgi:hypothetical protein
MKRIVIKEDQWGPSYLFDGERNTYCCLGFACLHLGKSRQEISGKEMPGEVGILHFDKTASCDLSERAMGAMSLHHGEYSLGNVAAFANDKYHDPDYAEIRGDLLKVMRQAFREAGFIFVLKKAAA